MNDIDFYITNVSYVDNVIDSVKIRLRLEPFTGESKIGAPRTVSRDFIYDLLRTGKLNIYTGIKTQSGYRAGEKVVLYDEFITTVSNESSKDNLENLPKF